MSSKKAEDNKATVGPKGTLVNLADSNRVYDFSALISASAVASKADNDDKIKALHIPDTEIPSPLASNLSPAQVMQLRSNLVDDGNTTIGNQIGSEIWWSWKRAWDLWNNHYIEGRVNRNWVAKEWERQTESIQSWDREKRARKGARIAAASGHTQQVPTDLGPLMPILHRRIGSHKAFERASNLGRSKSTAARTTQGRPDDLSTSVLSDTRPNDPMDIDDSLDPHELSDSEAPLPPTTMPDGSSGGWYPMQDSKEYQLPEFEPDGDDPAPWFDVVDNSVWRPRRVGEKELQIDLDQSVDEFLKNSKLELDGGVDCGRAPYPVLRPRIEYISTKRGGFKKKKIWDGVTGTVFNMPTKPLVPDAKTEDHSIQDVYNVYYDSTRDDKPAHNSDIFPLDIRRGARINEESKAQTPVCGKGERLVRKEDFYPKKAHRHMDPTDPWWVTGAQRKARDIPTRRFPLSPKEELDSRELPLDDSLWIEEHDKDVDRKAEYFVTNLHGGTLIVNGIEVKKGDVAGPLPRFAVILCPGNQIAFWWGVDGRSYGAGSDDDPEGLMQKWKSLEASGGIWKNVAKEPAEVWIHLIRDRIRKEKSGEIQDMDDEWSEWKEATTTAKPVSVGTGNDKPQDPGYYTAVPVFENTIAELKWLSGQEKETKMISAIRAKYSQVLRPTSLWPGKAPIETAGFNQGMIDEEWSHKRELVIRVQNDLNTRIEREKAKEKEKLNGEKRPKNQRKQQSGAAQNPKTKKIKLIHNRAKSEEQDAKYRKLIEEKEEKDGAQVKADIVTRWAENYRPTGAPQKLRPPPIAQTTSMEWTATEIKPTDLKLAAPRYQEEHEEFNNVLEGFKDRGDSILHSEEWEKRNEIFKALSDDYRNIWLAKRNLKAPNSSALLKMKKNKKKQKNGTKPQQRVMAKRPTLSDVLDTEEKEEAQLQRSMEMSLKKQNVTESENSHQFEDRQLMAETQEVRGSESFHQHVQHQMDETHAGEQVSKNSLEDEYSEENIMRTCLKQLRKAIRQRLRAKAHTYQMTPKEFLEQRHYNMTMNQYVAAERPKLIDEYAKRLETALEKPDPTSDKYRADRLRGPNDDMTKLARRVVIYEADTAVYEAELKKLSQREKGILNRDFLISSTVHDDLRGYAQIWNMARWRAWCNTLYSPQYHEYKIAGLPGPPRWSPPAVNPTTLEVWATV